MSPNKQMVPTAKDINAAHKLAGSCAETAVQHAIRCGQMLANLKASLPHGKFESWIKSECDFSPQTARVYIRAAAQNARGLAFSSLKSLFPNESPKTALPGPQRDSKIRPAAPEPDTSQLKQKPDSERQSESVIDEDVEPEKPTDEEEAEIDAVVDRNYHEAVAKAVDIGSQEQIRRLTEEIVSLKRARDSFMNKANAAAEMVTQRDRTIAKLRRSIQKLEEDLAAARERVAIMEEAA